MSRRTRPAAAACAAVAALALLAAAACSSASTFPEPAEPPLQNAAPWPDYERLTYRMLDQTDAELGSMIMETRREGGEWALSLRFEVDESGTVDQLTVWVDADTLAPRRYEREAVNKEERVTVAGEYESGADGAVTASATVDEDGEVASERIEAGAYAFDNDSAAWLWRRLRFEQDLELTYRSVNLFQRRSQLVQVAVRGQDQLQGPDGDVLVWQVVATPGVEVSRAWFEIDPPHRMIRWDQQPRRFVLTDISTTPE